jgi:hypothetical protein
MADRLRMFAAVGLAHAGIAANGVRAAPTETIRVELSLRTGGGLAGAVVDHNDHGLVIVNHDTPYVFSWTEIEGDSAYAVRRRLLELQRQGDERLTADDLVGLGFFALRMGRAEPAARDFRRAKSMDASKSVAIDAALRAFRESRAERDSLDSLPMKDSDDKSPASFEAEDSTLEEDSSSRESKSEDRVTLALGPLSGRRDEVLAVYKRFGEKVREVLGEQVVRLESEHFLIFTDFHARDRAKLIEWCESMYAALAGRFHLAPNEPLFLAKCPVFAFQSPPRFRRFARYFDGFDGVDALGYTRSIEANGHVHIVLLRQGRKREDVERFACTLVHEGTHGFIHRLFSSRLIPHWVNEGLAELTAAGVLGDRCPAKENAALLSKQFARYGWPIQDLLARAGPLEVYEYPVAHSVIAYLESRGGDRLTAFIRALKRGDTVEAALGGAFDGLTPARLEAEWRAWALPSAPPSATDVVEESARLPWSSGR